MGRPCAEIPQRSAGLLPGQPEMLISRGRPGLQRNRSCARCPLWGPRHANTAEGSWEASGAVILLPCQPLALSKEAGVTHAHSSHGGGRGRAKSQSTLCQGHTEPWPTRCSSREGVCGLRDTPPFSASHGACLLTTGTGRPAPQARRLGAPAAASGT